MDALPGIVHACCLVLVGALMLVAAFIDAKTRTYPNGLAAVLFLAALIGTLAGKGPETAMRHALIALLIGAGFLIFELIWRWLRASPGLGMGDIKFIATAAIISPVGALAGCVLGLACMALAAMASRARTMPLLPFLAPSCMLSFLMLYTG